MHMFIGHNPFVSGVCVLGACCRPWLVDVWRAQILTNDQL